jgi:hypothetical protein
MNLISSNVSGVRREEIAIQTFCSAALAPQSLKLSRFDIKTMTAKAGSDLIVIYTSSTASEGLRVRAIDG